MSWLSDDDCEDQGMSSTDVCIKYECQEWISGKQVKPILVLEGKYWICPKCHASYGESAK